MNSGFTVPLQQTEYIMRLFFKHNEQLSQIFIILKRQLKSSKAKGRSEVHHFTMGKVSGFFVLCLLSKVFRNILVNTNVTNRSELRNKQCVQPRINLGFFLLLWQMVCIPLIVGIVLKSVLKRWVFSVPSQKVGAAVN